MEIHISVLQDMRRRLKGRINLPALGFGHEEAEFDKNLLSNYFISNPVLHPILNGRRNIIIGPKGSGKSAINSFLLSDRHHRTKDGHNFEAIFKNQTFLCLPLQTPGEYHDLFFPTKAALSREYLETVWLSLFATFTCAEILGNQFLINMPAFEKFKVECRKAGFEIGRISKFLSSGKSLFSSLVRCLKVKVTPEGEAAFEFDFAKPDSNTLDPQKSNPWKVLCAADKLLTASNWKVGICIDDLDRIYTYTRPSESILIQALFRVNDSMKTLQAIRPLIFIRSDILNDAAISHSDKLLARSVDITWTIDKIIELMYMRFDAITEVRDILSELGNISEELLHKIIFFLVFPSFEDMTEESLESHFESFKSWLALSLCDANSSILPRSIIHMLNEATLTTRIQDEDNTLFNKQGLKESLRSVSSALTNVFMNDYVTAKQIVEIVTAHSMTEFMFKDIMTFFPRDEVPFVTNQLDILSKLGFISKVPITVNETNSVKKAYRYRVGPVFKHHWAIQGTI